MKIASEIKIAASAETIWQTLIDFENYPRWNKLNLMVKGQPIPDTKLEMDMQFRTQKKIKVQAILTGFIAPKYLSWSWQSKLGTWWFQAEQIMRIKEDAEGEMHFHHEFYFSGVRLRFIRRDLERYAQYSLDYMNEDLQTHLNGEN